MELQRLVPKSLKASGCGEGRGEVGWGARVSGTGHWTGTGEVTTGEREH